MEAKHATYLKACLCVYLYFACKASWEATIIIIVKPVCIGLKMVNLPLQLVNLPVLSPSANSR